MRAMVSVTPPAGTGTMSLTVPLGKVWAPAGTLATASSVSDAANSAGAARFVLLHMTLPLDVLFFDQGPPRCFLKNSTVSASARSASGFE